jgi:hypothetical protein
MWHGYAGFRFCFFFIKVIIIFFKCSIFTLFLDWGDVLMWTGILELYFVWQNVVQIIYWFTWK